MDAFTNYFHVIDKSYVKNVLARNQMWPQYLRYFTVHTVNTCKIYFVKPMGIFDRILRLGRHTLRNRTLGYLLYKMFSQVQFRQPKNWLPKKWQPKTWLVKNPILAAFKIYQGVDLYKGLHTRFQLWSNF